MSALAERLATLSPEKQALFAALNARSARRPARTERRPARISRRPAGAPAPLSHAQERLWFLHLLEPHSPAYNAPSAVRLEGVLDYRALSRALTEIARRHEILRTRFASGDDGRPLQIVEAPKPLAPTLIDLRGLPARGPLPLSFLRRPTPPSMYAFCQRHTVGLPTRASRQIALVPTPRPDNSTMLARLAIFCGVLPSATSRSSVARSLGPTYRHPSISRMRP